MFWFTSFGLKGSGLSVDGDNGGLNFRSDEQERAAAIRQAGSAICVAEYVGPLGPLKPPCYPASSKEFFRSTAPLSFCTCGMNPFAAPQLTGAGGGSVGLDLGSSWTA